MYAFAFFFFAFLFFSFLLHKAKPGTLSLLLVGFFPPSLSKRKKETNKQTNKQGEEESVCLWGLVGRSAMKNKKATVSRLKGRRRRLFGRAGLGWAGEGKRKGRQGAIPSRACVITYGVAWFT